MDILKILNRHVPVNDGGIYFQADVFSSNKKRKIMCLGIPGQELK